MNKTSEAPILFPVTENFETLLSCMPIHILHRSCKRPAQANSINGSTGIPILCAPVGLNPTYESSSVGSIDDNIFFSRIIKVLRRAIGRVLGPILGLQG